MDVRDLTLLNKQKRKILICIILLVLSAITTLFFLINNHGIVLAFTLPVCIALTIITAVSMGKVEKALILYVLSQFPDWKEEEHTRKKDNNLRKVFEEKKLFYALLPVYRNKSDASISDIFSSNNGVLNKYIAQIEYSEYEEHTKKDRHGRRETTYKCTYSFEAPMLAVQNSKDVRSMTYFQTNNYPPKTKKEIIEEKSELELQKVEMNGAAEYNIDVYTDNKDVAEKLATKELFIALQTIKRQFDLYYVKAVFSNDYIVFLLRDKNIENSARWLFPLFIKIPFFKSIDYPLLDKAASNFKALTDLADKAESFTKNI